jgi:hypothetical protein
VTGHGNPALGQELFRSSSREYHPLSPSGGRRCRAADAGTGVGRAVADHFSGPDGGRPVAVARRMRVKTGLADTDGALVPVPGGSEEPPLWELRAALTGLAQDAAIRSSGS